jgi:hypothetical protein
VREVSDNFDRKASNLLRIVLVEQFVNTAFSDAGGAIGFRSLETPEAASLNAFAICRVLDVPHIYRTTILTPMGCRISL